MGFEDIGEANKAWEKINKEIEEFLTILAKNDDEIKNLEQRIQQLSRLIKEIYNYLTSLNDNGLSEDEIGEILKEVKKQIEALHDAQMDMFNRLYGVITATGSKENNDPDIYINRIKLLIDLNTHKNDYFEILNSLNEFNLDEFNERLKNVYEEKLSIIDKITELHAAQMKLFHDNFTLINAAPNTTEECINKINEFQQLINYVGYYLKVLNALPKLDDKGKEKIVQEVSTFESALKVKIEGIQARPLSLLSTDGIGNSVLKVVEPNNKAVIKQVENALPELDDKGKEKIGAIERNLSKQSQSNSLNEKDIEISDFNFYACEIAKLSLFVTEIDCTLSSRIEEGRGVDDIKGILLRNVNLLTSLSALFKFCQESNDNYLKKKVSFLEGSINLVKSIYAKVNGIDKNNNIINIDSVPPIYAESEYGRYNPYTAQQEYIKTTL